MWKREREKNVLILRILSGRSQFCVISNVSKKIKIYNIVLYCVSQSNCNWLPFYSSRKKKNFVWIFEFFFNKLTHFMDALIKFFKQIGFDTRPPYIFLFVVFLSLCFLVAIRICCRWTQFCGPKKKNIFKEFEIQTLNEEVSRRRMCGTLLCYDRDIYTDFVFVFGSYV